MVSLKFAISKEDYANYYTYVMWDAPGNKKKRLYYYGKQLLPILLLLLAFYYTGFLNRSDKFILVVVGFFVATTLLSFLGIRTTTMRQADKVAEDPGNSSIFLEHQVTVSDGGIIIKDELKEIRFQWKAIAKKLESQNYYFLFHNSIQAIIIPKRVFISQDEKMQFEKLLAQHLSFDAEVSHLLKQN
ncbi:MAG: YcxB family protein [Ferruginibacter sp.]